VASRTVRISDAYYARIAVLAGRERRSVSNMLALVLSDGLALRDGSDSGAAVGESAVSGSARPSTREPERAAPDPHFRPDPKPVRK